MENCHERVRAVGWGTTHALVGERKSGDGHRDPKMAVLTAVNRDARRCLYESRCARNHFCDRYFPGAVLEDFLEGRLLGLVEPVDAGAAREHRDDVFVRIQGMARSARAEPLEADSIGLGCRFHVMAV